MRLATAVALVALVAVPASAADLTIFNRFFVDATMRIDLVHVGNAAEEIFTLERVHRHGIWAGSRTHLLDPFETGAYRAELLDAQSGQVIFSRGYDSYFGEYRTTAEAGAGARRAYSESILAPYPKGKVKLVIRHRGRDRAMTTLFETEIDPAAITVSREALRPGVTVIEAMANGDPHAKVDLAIVAEGYTATEEEKFRRDLERAVTVLFAVEPFASRRADFNVHGVFAPSAESGCDEPSRGVWRSTAIGASFDSLGSERYMLTEDNRALRDIAAHTPFDAVIILVNQARYGGGGIYNSFCTVTSDNQWTPYVLVHELGHAFAGLADEYYTSSVAYNEFYPKGVEPVEPNITALLDPKALKWRDLVTPGTAIPTPWEKQGFDALDRANQKVREEINGKIAAAMRSGAPAAEVEALKAEAERLSKEHAAAADAYLAKSAFVGVVGAFEGAGYAAEGLYRPMLDCIMFTKGSKPFCAVCRRAIERVVDHYRE